MSISSILYLVNPYLKYFIWSLLNHTHCNFQSFNNFQNGIRKNTRIVIKSVPCVNNYVGRYQVQTVNKDV